MHPWERRLRDLSNLLASCGKTYFAPDIFRQNTNQFLQTSRTVTFIIQKNKALIPDFDAWYNAHIVTPWSTDIVMTWAKDARNVIEKEGDLEMHSTLRATLLFSYIAAQDAVVETTRAELLHAGVDRLLRLAATKLPPGIADAAVLKIERRWVANSLRSSELLAALTYVYGRHFDAVNALATHLGTRPEATVPHPTSLDPAVTDSPKTRYIKLTSPGLGRLESKRLTADPTFKVPPSILTLKEALDSRGKPQSLREVVDLLARVAEATYRHYGNHVPMLFLFDDAWRGLDFLSAQFADQAEKFVFWRHAAERAAYQRAFAAVWISETWLRDMEERGGIPIRDMPIIGEHLNVIGASADGSESVVSWQIHRDASGKPTLVPSERTTEQGAELTNFFLKPVVDAMRAARGEGAGPRVR